MPGLQSPGECALKGSERKELLQARQAFTLLSAQFGLGQVTWDADSSTFEYGGHTIRVRAPDGGRAVFIGRDGKETSYACLSPGVFKALSGVIVLDFGPIVRREVEALLREVGA
jgi:hypothetical protein